MDIIKLNNSEIRVMELLWPAAPQTAKELCLLAAEELGWNKNTTYTVLKGLVEKGAVRREDPGFCCIPLVTEEQIQRQETKSHIDRFYKGSVRMFFSSLLDSEDLAPGDWEELRRMIDEKQGL